MANKGLFATAIAKSLPAADAVNREGAPAYAYGPEALLAQFAAIGTLGDAYYSTAGVRHRRTLRPWRDARLGEHRQARGGLRESGRGEC